MKNRTLMAAAALLIALCSSSAFAQTEQADCDRIRAAAENGRTRALERLGNMESTVKDQVANARSCMERFGDMAARQTINIGGFDVAPIRDAIFNNACSVVQGKVSQVQGQVSNAYSQVTNLPQTAINAATSGVTSTVVNQAANQAINQISNPPSSGWSIWDRVSNFFSGAP
jgi:hypothetical protein